MDNRKFKVAAVLRLTDMDSPNLFSNELLFKPLIDWLGEALLNGGVSMVLLVADDDPGFHFAIGTEFDTFIRIGETGMHEAIKGIVAGEYDAVVTLARPAFFDEPAMAELISTLKSRNKVTLMSGGLHTGVYGLSGKEAADPAMIENLLYGSSDPTGFYDLECMDTGSQGFIIKTIEDLCYIEELLRDSINSAHMRNGVRFIGADTSFISPDVKIDPGCTIMPNTILKGNTRVSSGCVVGPNTVISNCTVGQKTEVNASQLNDSTIGDNVKIGPFAYIRPGCSVGNNIRIGDFVELKKAKIGNGTKISHLTYVGDAEVGENVNFGCGTVTANYDGVNKHLTVIEDGAFIGCNTNLIAPVRIGKNATTAAGTTVTMNVPEGSLAIGRVRQTVKSNWNRTKKTPTNDLD